MSEQNVPVQQTPISMRTYARAVALAWLAAFGVLPTKEQVGVLWGQYGIETGAGPNCWNWNIGNVKHVPGDGHDYMMLAGTWEMVAGKRVVYQPPARQTWFRAFPDLDTAMRDHFALLRGRFGRCWPAVEAGDCTAFAHALKAGPDGKEGTWDDYFTGNVDQYAAGMLAHFARWMASDAFDRAIAEVALTPANDVDDVDDPAVIDGGTVHAELFGDEPPPDAA